MVDNINYYNNMTQSSRIFQAIQIGSLSIYNTHQSTRNLHLQTQIWQRQMTLEGMVLSGSIHNYLAGLIVLIVCKSSYLGIHKRLKIQKGESDQQTIL